MSRDDGLPTLTFSSQADWEEWLDENHAKADGVWIKIAKKASGIPTVTAAEAIDSCLCFGWIDGQRRGLDDTWFLQRYTPRRPRSRWSQVNVAKVAELTAAGRMRASGLAEVERAKADGRWDAAYASQRNMAVPADLEEALAANPAAGETFAGLSASSRYQILLALHDAKRPETRERRMAKFLARLEAGERNF